MLVLADFGIFCNTYRVLRCLHDICDFAKAIHHRARKRLAFDNNLSRLFSDYCKHRVILFVII